MRTLTQACDGLVRYKSTVGMSPNTLRNYLVTFAKLQAFFDDDPPFPAITRDQLITFFAYLVLCARDVRPDVILMDLRMPRMDGIEATRQITAGRREMGVLVLTSFATDEDVFPALKAGALGYLLKDTSSAELVCGLRRVARGESKLDPGISRRLLEEVSHQREPKLAGEELTLRETEVLRLVVAGLRNQAIADCMTISERTVRTHVSHILAKLHLTSRTQVALYAVREGLAEPHKARADAE